MSSIFCDLEALQNWIEENAPRNRREGSFLGNEEFHNLVIDNSHFGKWRGTDVNGKKFETRDGCIQFHSQQAKMNGGTIGSIMTGILSGLVTGSRTGNIYGAVLGSLVGAFAGAETAASLSKPGGQCPF